MKLLNIVSLSCLSAPEHHREDFCPSDDSTLQLLHPSHQPISVQDIEDDAHFYGDNEPEERFTKGIVSTPHIVYTTMSISCKFNKCYFVTIQYHL